MSRRIRFEPLLALDGAVDLPRRNDPFLDQAVRDHCRDRPIEEVQNPVMNSLKADAEFVNTVAQEVGLGPPFWALNLSLFANLRNCKYSG